MLTDRKRTANAATALLHWLEDQNLTPMQSVPVLVLALAATIQGVANQNGLDAVEGGEAASRGLIEALEIAKREGLIVKH